MLLVQLLALLSHKLVGSAQRQLSVVWLLRLLAHLLVQALYLAALAFLDRPPALVMRLRSVRHQDSTFRSGRLTASGAHLDSRHTLRSRMGRRLVSAPHMAALRCLNRSSRCMGVVAV
jgi:hypothetical protein